MKSASSYGWMGVGGMGGGVGEAASRPQQSDIPFNKQSLCDRSQPGGGTWFDSNLV